MKEIEELIAELLQCTTAEIERCTAEYMTQEQVTDAGRNIINKISSRVIAEKQRGGTGIMDSGIVFERLLKIAHQKGLRVLFADFPVRYGAIAGENIGMNYSMDISEINFTLAHELAHAYLHQENGELKKSLADDPEEQADRTAQLLLDVLSTI